MESALPEIALGLIVPSILGLVKLFMNHAVLKANHDSLQSEVDEMKRNNKDDLKELKAEIKEHFEKMERLVEKLFKYEKDNNA